MVNSVDSVLYMMTLHLCAVSASAVTVAVAVTVTVAVAVPGTRDAVIGVMEETLGT